MSVKVSSSFPGQVINRRHFLAAGGVLATAAITGIGKPVHAKGTVAVDDGEAIIVSDGNLVLPPSFLAPAAPQDEVRALLESAGLPIGSLEPDCNITFVRKGDRLIAFDVGAGPNFMPSAGKLAENMEDAGIDPAEVTDVIFTHAHPDHLWGLLDDFDELTFPDADYHMAEAEWDFWRADDTLDKMPEERKTFVVGAQNRLAELADRIMLFSSGAEVVSGVEAVDTSGHTPGHTSFMVGSGENGLFIVGDAITNVAVSFAKPDWHSGSDQNPEKGAKTRLALLDRLASENTPIIGFHMPHPGAGRVERSGTAYRFVADS